MSILLSTAFCPPVEYFAAIATDLEGLAESIDGVYGKLKPAELIIEAHENYQKQSWRNRTRIYAADGALNLNYPIKHSDLHLPISKVQIDYSTNWKLKHKRAIISAYRTSAYFEYYQDDFFEIFDRDIESLLEFNTTLTLFFLDKIGIPVNLRYTDNYNNSYDNYEEANTISYNDTVKPNSKAVSANYAEVKASAEGVNIINERVWDLREVIHPKRENTILSDLGLKKPYYQVFASKYGFLSSMSIMDLLFNEGPDSIVFLKNLKTLHQK